VSVFEGIEYRKSTRRRLNDEEEASITTPTTATKTKTEQNGIICKILAQYKEAQRQLDKEEEEKSKKNKRSQPFSR
jgi:hypothetical protein